MNLDKLVTDPEMEKGTWVNLDPSCQVRVVYTNSPEYRFKLRAKMKPLNQVLSRTRDFDDTMSIADQEKLTIDMLVDHTLLDWRGVEFKGKQVPYTKENARMILTAVPAFREMVEQAAGTLSNFRSLEIEEESKNLEPTSVGS
jgi:hypothetical protein